jgi:flavin reductase (DIM6/NTAB) family NADH-FMN oxidoreductase RutF
MSAQPTDEIPDVAKSADRFIQGSEYPLYVVTASAGAEKAGCLAGFVTQSSINPIQFVVCISKINHTYRIAEQSEGLAVHLLGADQQGVASLFGEVTGDDIDKFDGISWTRGVTLAPRLVDCAAWIEGPIIDRMSGGDHEAFLIAVTSAGAGDRKGHFMLSDAGHFEPGHPE